MRSQVAEVSGRCGGLFGFCFAPLVRTVLSHRSFCPPPCTRLSCSSALSVGSFPIAPCEHLICKVTVWIAFSGHWVVRRQKGAKCSYRLATEFA